MKKIKRSKSKHWIELFKGSEAYALIIHIDKDGHSIENIIISEEEAKKLSEILNIYIRQYIDSSKTIIGTIEK